MKRNIVLLGSTGSIGTQTLEVVRANPQDLRITALAANKNVELIEKQIREFRPSMACMFDEKAASDLKERVSDLDVRVFSGMDGLLELVTDEDADTVLTAVVGMIGIRPTIAAINAGKDIALANKETLVCAGHIIMPLAKEKNVQILPVDSEHSAIFQSLNGEPRNKIEKILLTASGGTFRTRKAEELENVTVDEALNNPNWDMGAKVTIDSASLVNKGLEVIEARWLFDVDADHIQVVIQPQSILHSAVQFVDGAVIGQMGVPDMKLPIQYALFYPDRMPLSERRLDLFELGSIIFEKPRTDVFKGLPLAFRALREGGSMPTVFNAANEMAVKKFMRREIHFLDIYDMITEAMDHHSTINDPTVEQILDVEKEVYEYFSK